jgi:uncharacterized lipoprotein YmbA
MPSEAERVRNYRAYKSSIKLVRKLKEHDLITARQERWLDRITRELYARLKDDFRRKRKPSFKLRGRPRIPERAAVFTTCKKVGCSKPPASGQAYCSKECAPCAYLLEQSE